MNETPRRAVYLDRDGTVIHDNGYPRDPERVRLMPGAAAALARLREAGFLLVLVSNQSGIGRGLITATEAERVHQRLVELLEREGVRLDGACYCPHGPEDGCGCRKPAPGLLLRAAAELHVDPAQSFMVGDKLSDMEAGQRAGCRTILLADRTSPAAGRPGPDSVAADWQEALEQILGAAERKA